MRSGLERWALVSSTVAWPAGVGVASPHLRARLSEVAKKGGVKLHIPTLDLCGDNGAMIAVAAYFEYERGNFADSSLNASALDSIV